MERTPKTSILEKACSKIDAIIETIPSTSDRKTINAAVREVIFDLETAIAEIKNICQEKKYTGSEKKKINPALPNL